MAEKQTPMPKDAAEESVESTVWALCDQHDKRLFEDLDKLHSRGMHDTAVIRALRKGGYAETAAAYIEWGSCIDPDEDPTPQGEELVTDPIDAPSYAGHPLNRTAKDAQ